MAPSTTTKCTTDLVFVGAYKCQDSIEIIILDQPHMEKTKKRRWPGALGDPLLPAIKIDKKCPWAEELESADEQRALRQRGDNGAEKIRA